MFKKRVAIMLVVCLLVSLVTVTGVVKTKATDDTITIDISSKGYENGTAIEEIEQDDITITFGQGTNSSNPPNVPKYYDTGTSIRVYGGNTFSIDYDGDTEITKIEFVFGKKSSTEQAGSLSANVGTYSKPVWTGESYSVSFSNSSGQAYLQKIIITIGAGAAPFPQDATPEEVWDAAIEGTLPAGYIRTFTGVVTAINTAYSSQYKNITVTIVVDGLDNKPFKCFRLENSENFGVEEGVKVLEVNDTITVKGTIIRYKENGNWIVEFDAGCQLLELIPGEHGETPTYETPEEIWDAANELSHNSTLPGGPYKLEGVVTEIVEKKNNYITVNMVVDDLTDKPFQCYKLVNDSTIASGKGIELLSVGDTITVKGQIKKYNDLVEFDNGCKLIEIDHIARITSASLSLSSSIAINFKVDENEFDTTKYTPLLKVTFDGKETPLRATKVDTDYVFTFSDLTPAQMTEVASAQLYLSAVVDGESVFVKSGSKDYSIAEYCYNQLRKEENAENEELLKLLVDILVYGDAAMEYTGKSGTRPTYDLTDAERAHGTQGKPDVNGFGNVTIRPDEGGLVWKGAGLNLTDSIMIRVKFQAVMDEDHSFVSVQDDDTDETFQISSEDLLPVEGAENTYYAFFPLSSPAALKKKYIFRVNYYYAELDYSASYYVKSMLSKDISGETRDLLYAMTNYCLSAEAFVAAQTNNG